MKTYLDSLNDQQKAAVLHEEGPAMVLAGAGSGKTRVLTTRATWLIDKKDIDPTELLLVTFTNKAAHEMKERVQQLTGSRLPHTGTFHSICARLLRREGHHLGIGQNFVIYDSDDQLQLIKHLYKKHDYDKKRYKPKGVKATISQAKNELLSPAEYEAMARGDFQAHAGKVFRQYQAALREANAVDFDDLLLETVRLFDRHPAVLEKYQEQFIHVLVDEYQDTNKAQYRLTSQLTAPHNNLYVVGDFSQSIYAWRGADYRNMLQLRQKFEKITEYRLERNYRSTQAILDAASHVISKNTTHPILELWTDQDGTDSHVVYGATDHTEEARRVVREIQDLRADHSLSEMAILYRTNAQSRSFEESLMRAGIPYRIVGGFKFYDRQEIKDVLAYLRVYLNPDDTVSRERAVKRGKRRLRKLEALREKHSKEDVNPDTAILLQDILEATYYRDRYDEKDPDDLSRLENVEELLAVAVDFDDPIAFLENVALIQDNTMIKVEEGNPEEMTRAEEAVTLMSLHSAKGLEFEVVFMVGMEDGLLPHSRSIMEKEKLEEERRLCYVGITRAKKQLYFTFARRRFQYGQSSNTTPSRFLEDIPQHLLHLETPLHNVTGSSNSYGRNNRNSSSNNSGRRYVPLDDASMDAVLSGDLDVDDFLG